MGLTVPECHLSNTLVTEPEKMVSRSLTFDSPSKRENSMAEPMLWKQRSLSPPPHTHNIRPLSSTNILIAFFILRPQGFQGSHDFGKGRKLKWNSRTDTHNLQLIGSLRIWGAKVTVILRLWVCTRIRIIKQKLCRISL